jgi:DNA-directed RNA polymerase specialized sigma subunit
VEIVQDFARRGRKVAKSTVSQAVNKKRWVDLAAVLQEGLKSISDRDRKVIEMWDSGETEGAIADLFDLSRGRVSEILRKTAR